MPTPTPDTFKVLLGKLVKTPESFTADDLKVALNLLFTPDVVLPAQVGAFLLALHNARVERRPENLAAAADALRARAVKIVFEDGDKDFVVDIVGTGGDGHNTFNVSTTAAIVAAGAGARVVKVSTSFISYTLIKTATTQQTSNIATQHGSRASTSSSGSADLLERLDCLFVPPTPGTVVPIPQVPFTFILAPHYHPSLAMIAPYRRALPFRTLFNVLGPLINPAHPKGMVLGVAERELGPAFAKSLLDVGVQRALVVCGAENLDEISCAGDTWVWEIRDGQITEAKLHPERFGLPVHPLTAVAGGTAAENAETFKTLLRSGLAEDYKHGVRLALESMKSGAAWKALEAFRDTGRLAMSKVESPKQD
ncbi:glycosyl transferase [Pisolithus sp. B1]|nr:glycosyl transferase [Pisolithus sp. B1]